ncbi:glycine cleavage system protein R [Kordiimonas gwangyangensis]|uniref:glycine cleavage system protein R n=1 Tax=Kordiimonas gwangyangensis TaxID=288022 RepID=UPI00035CFBFB|nr:ACT domain-containing protein [Kordiimonas gwangyangensis]
MTTHSTDKYLISIIGRDQRGVVSAVTGYLFEIGANLADSAFAVLGEGFEFSCVAEFTAGADADEVSSGLEALELLDGARITVTSFPFGLARGETAVITHVVDISGGDRPGLVARISEVLMDYDANIVRMSSKRVPTDGGFDYRTRFAINVGEGRFTALEAALYNTAGSLRLNCGVEVVNQDAADED